MAVWAEGSAARLVTELDHGARLRRQVQGTAAAPGAAVAGAAQAEICPPPHPLAVTVLTAGSPIRFEITGFGEAPGSATAHRLAALRGRPCGGALLRP